MCLVNSFSNKQELEIDKIDCGIMLGLSNNTDYQKILTNNSVGGCVSLPRPTT